MDNYCKNCDIIYPRSKLLCYKCGRVLHLDSRGRECTIFNSNDYNKLTLNDEILFFGKYIPSHHGHNSLRKNDRFSQHILDVKNASKEYDLSEKSKRSLRYFLWEFEKILDFYSEYTICVLPSSNQGLENSGIRIIANNLANYLYDGLYDDEERFFSFSHLLAQELESEAGYLITDGTSVLLRTKSILPKHQGGTRGNINYEMDSLEVQDKHLIKGKQVLLLDDVTTSGASLRAGQQLLLEAGAKIVVPLALGQTEKNHMFGKQI